MLYFLNDVEEGGETAFPVANNETFSIEVINMLPIKPFAEYSDHEMSMHNSSTGCSASTS